MKVVFRPGCFPDDMTQEEIDEMVDTLTKMANDGTLFENSEPIDLDELEENDPEAYAKLIQDTTLQ